MTGALQLEQRFRRAADALGYLAVSVPLALAGVVVLCALALGALLSLVVVCVPLLTTAASAARSLVSADRRAANRLLAAQLPPVAPAEEPPPGPALERARAVLADRSLWRVAAHLALKPLIVAAVLLAAL
ncbi:MAG: sensor domain-containing protein, partial [Solirubrobacterales bacterium]|nr:sensor domain-containing protein [Solirubrobacterales bacterium]